MKIFLTNSFQIQNAVSKLKIGNPLDNPDLGPVVSKVNITKLPVCYITLFNVVLK